MTLALVVEILLLLVVAALGAGAASLTADSAVAAALLRGYPSDAAAVKAAVTAATSWLSGGIVLVALVRAATAFRRGNHIRTPLLLPAIYLACVLGLTIQLAYVSPFRSQWPDTGFAQGVFYGSVAVAAVLAVPGDLPALIYRGRVLWAGLAAGLFLLLGIFGKAPEGTDQQINLWGFQPIELIKILGVLALGSFLGGDASRLRFHRVRVLGIYFPRLTLLIPALGAMLVILIGLKVVNDLGPILIFGSLFLAMFYVVTRSSGWVFSAGAVLGSLLLVLRIFPDLAPGSIPLRLKMWADPWYNVLANGNQLAQGYWTFAAGGLSGTGAGSSWPGALPAGDTDFAYAHLVEEHGLLGALAYLLALSIAIVDGLRVAANNRTADRQLMAAGLGLLLALQVAVILSGTLGLMPLTGVVVPFISFGKSSMIAFLVVAALIARFGEDGQPRADTEELAEVRGAVAWVQGAVLVGALFFGLVTAERALWKRDEVSLRGIVTILGDGSHRIEHDPRVEAVAARIRRGPILDRNNQPLAETLDGKRSYPLGSALGTLLGPEDEGILREPWSIERLSNEQLRGWPNREDGPAVWVAKFEGKGERVVLAVASSKAVDPSEQGRAEKRASELGSSGGLRRIPLADPDYSSLLPIARLPLEARLRAAEQRSGEIEARTIRLTIDARLQSALAGRVKTAAAKSAVKAAAAVVLNPATGEILARAQWPDYDPAGEDWRKSRIAADPKFMGIYGPWKDKTGLYGVYQAGSVFKILTAVLAAREGKIQDIKFATNKDGTTATCPSASGPVFSCELVDEGRMAFTLPGWSRPIHDHGDGGGQGKVDLVKGISKSSNVYFSQLALDLGSLPFRKIREEGVEYGNPGLLNETEGPFTGIGSSASRRLAQTGFGQGAASWSVVQAARFFGALANGGLYLRCPSEMSLGAACQSTRIFPEDVDISPILAGMSEVMKSGTGARLAKLTGIRVYGKTGTADAPGQKDEKIYGIKPGSMGSPHSWFAAIAEPAETTTACGESPAGRYVVVAVVPHGGFGASVAGPLVMDTLKDMQSLGFFP